MKKYIVYICILILALVATYFITSYLNSLRSFEIVVSRYNESLDWLNTEFPNEKITIYNKGENNITPQPNWNIIPLPNIGRESHTYLYHIISNYNNLADRTLFLQGNPYDHLGDVYLPFIKYKTIMFYRLSSKCKNIIARCGNPVTSYIKSFYKKDRDRLDNLSTYLQSMMHYFKEKSVFFKEENASNNMSNFIIRNLNRNLPKETVIGWSFGAQFAIDKDTILHHDIKYYENLIKILDNPNPIEGYFFEKSWDIIFDNGKYKDLN